MKVLVIGGGGREHALVWKLAENKSIGKIWCAPGNAGIGEIAECLPIKATDLDGIVAFVEAGARPRLQVRTTKVRKGAVRRQTLDVISSTGACAVPLPARGARVKLTAARLHGTLVVSACAATTGVRSLRRASRP